MDYSKKHYSFSFFAVAGLMSETITTAGQLSINKGWAETEEAIYSGNLFLRNRKNTVKRMLQEIRKRLESLTPGQRALVTEGDYDTAKQIIALAIFKTYPFLAEFAITVMREKYLTYDRHLYEADYRHFYDQITLLDPAAGELAESTQRKIRTATFLIFTQIGMLNNTKERLIVQPILQAAVLQAIREDNPHWLRCFLFSERDIINGTI